MSCSRELDFFQVFHNFSYISVRNSARPFVEPYKFSYLFSLEVTWLPEHSKVWGSNPGRTYFFSMFVNEHFSRDISIVGVLIV